MVNDRKLKLQYRLPNTVWYIGTPLQSRDFALHHRSTEDGQLYTFVWTRESIAQRFEATSSYKELGQTTDIRAEVMKKTFGRWYGDYREAFTVNSSVCEDLLIKCISADPPISWVILDPVSDSDDLLNDNSLNRIDCNSVSSLFPHLRNFSISITDTNGKFQKRIDIVQLMADELLASGMASPEFNPNEEIKTLKEKCGAFAHITQINSDIRPNVLFEIVKTSSGQLHCELTALERSVSSEYNRIAKLRADAVEHQQKRDRYVPKAVRREVWRRDQGRCVECGSQENIEYDHIIAFRLGGSNTVRNIQLLCESCNRSKGGKEPGY